MFEPDHTVALVVDPHFGSRVDALSRRVHVWVLSSPDNTPAAHAVWEKYSDDTLESGVTTFQRSGGSAEDEAANMIGTIELHHGRLSHHPPLDRLEVFGARPRGGLVAELHYHGFSVVKETQRGFIADCYVRDPAG